MTQGRFFCPQILSTEARTAAVIAALAQSFATTGKSLTPSERVGGLALKGPHIQCAFGAAYHGQRGGVGCCGSREIGDFIHQGHIAH